jgi:transposase
MVADSKQQTDYSGVDLARAIEMLSEKDEQLSLLLHRLKQLEKMVYGPRSSKRTDPVDPSTLLPFPGLQDLLDSVAARAEARAAEKKAEEGSDKPEKKKPAKRKGPRSLDTDIPDHLPRLRKDRKLDADECNCGCGGKLFEVREEVSRRIEQIKLLYVDEVVTTYYACRSCETMVSVAPDRDAVVEGGVLGPGLLANLVYQRFGNHTPYHRLEREFEQMGFPISRNVIGRNVLKCGELLQPIYDCMQQDVIGSFLVQIDDTPVVVRNGKKKGRTTGRIWIYRAPDGNVIFDFRMDRCQEGPRNVVGDFRGFIQGDAYSGHDFLFRNNHDRIELGCWAHGVRKFRDAGESDKQLLAEFDVLYALLAKVEEEAREMSPSERFFHRLQHARPVLAETHDWLAARKTTVAPKSPMGRAIQYVENHWQALNNYLLDGRITDITNNAAERALRRVAIGRKNWMHIGIEEAGQPAVVLMSILQTCAEQGVNALEYLRDVLVHIGQPGSAAEIRELTPLGWKNSEAAQARVAQQRAAAANAVKALAYTEQPSA